MPLDQRLLEVLACPADRAGLREEQATLICVACGRRYPVRQDIPVLVLDDAERS